MKQVTAHKCDWCNRTFLHPGNGRAHENSCRKNPARRHCITCVHGVMAETLGPMDYAENGYREHITAPFCDLHKTPIYEAPYFIDCEEDEYDVGVDGYGFKHETAPCPGTCQGYEYKGCAKWDAKERAGKEREHEQSNGAAQQPLPWANGRQPPTC